MCRDISLTQDFRELLLEKGFIRSYVENINSCFLINLNGTAGNILVSYFYPDDLLDKDIDDLYLESCAKRLDSISRIYNFKFRIAKDYADIDTNNDYVKVYYKCVYREGGSVQILGECERFHKGNRLTLTSTGKFEVNGCIDIENEVDRNISNRCKPNIGNAKISELRHFFIQVENNDENVEELLDRLINLSHKVYDSIDAAINYNTEHVDTISSINCLGYAYGVDTWVKPPFASLNLENYWNSVAFLYDFSKDKEIQKTIVQVLEETLRGYDSTIYCRVIDSIIELGQNETLTLLYVEEGGIEYHAIKYSDGNWLHKLGNDFVYYISTDMNPLETNTWASSADYYSCDAMPIMVATGHNQVSSFN